MANLQKTSECLHLRAAVRRRFLTLYDALGIILRKDECPEARVNILWLMPYLFRVFVLIWCRRPSDLVTKRVSDISEFSRLVK